MANKIIIPAYKLKLKDLESSIPNGKFNKIIFQCALKTLAGNNATFSVVVFAGKRNLGKWHYGKQLDCDLDIGKPDKEFDLADYSKPISIGNNEVYHSHFTLKEKKLAKTNKKMVKQDDLLKKIKKILKDPEKSQNAYLTFTAKINSPLSFDVSIDGTSASTNPCPPNQPGN